MVRRDLYCSTVMPAICKLLKASRLVASAPQTCVLLAAIQEEPARVVVGASADLKIDCGTLLREALAVYGLRGGGSASNGAGPDSRCPFGRPSSRTPRRPSQASH